jgi:hypothetical protein
MKRKNSSVDRKDIERGCFHGKPTKGRVSIKKGDDQDKTSEWERRGKLKKAFDLMIIIIV